MTSLSNNVIDWPRSVKLANNKPELAQQMLDMLIEELPSAKSDILSTYNAKDFERMHSHVHKLHGATCYTGVPQLKENVSEIETLLKTDIDEKKLSILVGQFGQLVDTIIQSFKDGNYK